MEKIQDSFHHRYFGRIIDEETIRELIEIFSEHCSNVEVELFDKKYKYASLAEVREQGRGKIVRLEISGRNPYATLTVGYEHVTGILWREDNTVYVAAGPKAESLFLKLRSRLDKRWGILRLIFNWPMWILVSTTLAISAYSPVRNFLNSHLRLTVASLSTLSWLYFIPFMIFYFRGTTFINAGPAHATSTFWKRNKDDILKIIFGAIIGGIITALFTKLFPSR